MAELADLPRRVWRAVRWVGHLTGLCLGSALRSDSKLPPGGLGPFSLARFGDDRFYARKFRRHGPIFKVLWNQNLTTCIVGFERARRLFAAHSQALLPLTVDIESFVPYGFMRSMAREHHAHYRGLFLTALRDELTVAWEPELRALIRAGLAGLSNRTPSSAAAGSPALTPALDRIVTRAMLMMFFGLRPGHPMFERLEAGYQQLGPHEFVYPIGPQQRAAFDALRGCIWQSVQSLKADAAWADGEGVLGRIVRQDASLVDETTVGNLIYMIEMGRYDVRSLMRWVLKYLSDAPAVVADLRGSGDAAPGSGKASAAEAVVLETLRLDQAEALNRAVTEDFVFDGYYIPKGSALRVLIRESHQDPEAFPEPEQFTPCRFAGRSHSGQAYAPFGVGEHRCIAAPTVVRLSTLLVEELVAGYTWVVAGDGSRCRGRYHWEPAPTFELALQPIERVAP